MLNTLIPLDAVERVHSRDLLSIFIQRNGAYPCIKGIYQPGEAFVVSIPRVVIKKKIYDGRWENGYLSTVKRPYLNHFRFYDRRVYSLYTTI